MFDGISPNHRIVGSMLETKQNLHVRTASSAEDARQQKKISRAPFIAGNDLLLENEPACGNRVEHSPQFFWAQCSKRWPSALHFRSIIQPNYQKLNQPINRGARLHEIRDCSHNSHRAAADLCGCDECQDHVEALNKLYSDHDDAMPGGPQGDRSQAANIERSNAESVLDTLNHLQAKGLLSSQQAQMAAAAIAVRPMYNNAKI